MLIVFDLALTVYVVSMPYNMTLVNIILAEMVWFNTLSQRQMAVFLQTALWNEFIKFINFDYISLKFVQYSIISQDNGSTSTRRQTIIGTNDE